MFSVVEQADSATRRDLEEWSRVASVNVNRAIEENSPIRRDISRNARLISLIQEDSVSTPENFRGVRDSSGNLQAGAIVNNMEDHLYLDYIATAPWNVTFDSPRSLRGAGRALMAQLVRESIENGHGGRIIADVAGSASFYQRIGFVPTGEGSQLAPEMELTPEAARNFLDTQR